MDKLIQETKQPATTRFEGRYSLSKDLRDQMVELLNQELADMFDLYSQTKQAHWNVKGPQFFQLHELFDELAAELIGYVDMIAERITALGGIAHGTVRMAASESRLVGYPSDVFGSMETVSALADRYAAVAANARDAIENAEDAGDMATSDLFTEITRKIDKRLWFLQAHVQK